MNELESQIVSALAPWRGSETPRHSKLAAGQDRGSRGAPSEFQNRPPHQSANVVGTIGAGGDMRNPWPDRPRFSGRRAGGIEAARTIAAKPFVMACFVLFALSGIFHAVHSAGHTGQVVVETIWPL